MSMPGAKTVSSRYEAVVIGASAGAIEALSIILPGLPKTFPLPIIIVIHLPPDRSSVLVDIMKGKCALPVLEAEGTMHIEPGHVYFAPPDYHLLVEKSRELSLSSEEPVHYSRPSIDLLFETASDAYDKKLVALVLTGANADGAAGIAKICRNGGLAIVQNPAESLATAMPEAAIKACPGALVMSLSEMRDVLATIHIT